MSPSLPPSCWVGFLSFFLSSRIVSFLDPTVGWWDGIHIHEPLTPTRDGETCGGKKQKEGHRMRKGRPETAPGLVGTFRWVHGKKRRKTREEIDRETTIHPSKGRKEGRREEGGGPGPEWMRREAGVCVWCVWWWGEDSSWKVLSRMSTVCVDWSGRRAAFHISTHHRRIHHQRSDMAASAMTSTFVGTNVHAKARVSHAKAGRRAALTTRCGAYDEELVATAVRARRMRSKKRNAKRYACQQPSTKRRDEERAMHPRWSVAATTATEKKKKNAAHQDDPKKERRGTNDKSTIRSVSGTVHVSIWTNGLLQT